MVQMTAARWTLCRFSSYDSVSNMFGELGWKPLRDRHTDSQLCLFYKIAHGLVAVPLSPYAVHAQVFTRHSTSHPQAFRQIQTVAGYYKYSFFSPSTIAQRSLQAASSIALLPDIDSFRLAVSSLSYSKPQTGSIVFNLYLCTLTLSDFIHFNFSSLSHSHLFYPPVIILTALTPGLKHTGHLHIISPSGCCSISRYINR